MTFSKSPEPASKTSISSHLTSIQELRQWFSRTLIVDFRRLEQLRKSTIKTIIIATIIFSILLGGILYLSWNLLPRNTVTVVKQTTLATTDLAKICATETVRPECSLLSNSQGNAVFSQLPTDSNLASGYSWIDLYQILAAILLVIVILVWLFLTLVGGAIDNYRLGWRSQMVRKIINFIDRDRAITYMGSADTEYVRQSLLHSGMVSYAGKDLIYIDVSDAIAIGQQNHRISWSNVRATINSTSILGILDRLFQIIHTDFGLRKLVKINFASIIIKALRAVTYLSQCAIRQKIFDYDDFSREAIGNDAGRKILFQGIFCQIWLADEDELGQILVLPKQSQNQSFAVKISPHLRNVKLEDPEFERVFTVHSSDRQTPIQIISPNIWRHILDYYRCSNYPLYLSVNGRIAYIAMIIPSPLLEPKIGQNMLSFAPIQDYYQSVEFMLNIADGLIATPDQD